MKRWINLSVWLLDMALASALCWVLWHPLNAPSTTASAATTTPRFSVSGVPSGKGGPAPLNWYAVIWQHAALTGATVSRSSGHSAPALQIGGFKLVATLVDADQRFAVLTDDTGLQILRAEGDKLGDMTIQQISTAGIVLQNGSQTLRWPLNPPKIVLPKPTAPSPAAGDE